VIFVTVGSQLGFDRMTAAVAQWARARGRTDLFFQTGATAADLRGFASEPLLGAAEIARLYDEADLVVAHAGTGSIIECMLRGKPIIVLPRSAALHETRNDHQFATARRFAERAGVHVAWNESELAPLLDRAVDPRGGITGGAGIGPYADERLLAALRAFVAE
jgi:UDP-N-acetylglucosamine transferase subunit ALG13